MAIFHLPCPHPRPRRCAMATMATVAAQSQAAVDADAVDCEALPPGTVPWCGLRPTLENPMIQVFWTNKLHQREIYWNIYYIIYILYNLYPPTPAFAKAGAAPGTTGGVEPALSRPWPSHCPRLPPRPVAVWPWHCPRLPPRPVAVSLACIALFKCLNCSAGLCTKPCGREPLLFQRCSLPFACT